jgi:mono/diheme cytochrome c family protein
VNARFVTAASLLALLTACRGQPSSEPPYHLVPDMDHQPKYKAQSENPFFADGKSGRNFVDGTMPIEAYHADDAPYTGKSEDGAWLTRPPMNVDEAVLARGEQRFNIYCAPCHDKTGGGQGLVIKHGYPIPVNLASEHTRGLKDGELFDIISNGVRNMPSYRTQIPAADRWAIATWVRVLQKSQAGKQSDVPAGTSIQPESATP